MKNIFVTGAAGFLGSHVADELTLRGYDVILFDIKDSSYKQSKQKMVTGNLADFELLKSATENIDCVFHFAGMAGIEECVTNPQGTVQNNILGTVNLLEACRLNKVQRFIFASSVYVFSDQGGFYRSSKRACESYIDDYQKIYGLDYTILRYGSLYGERCTDGNRFQKILEAFVENCECSLSGKDSDIREYIHVRDAARLTVDSLDDKFKNARLTITGLEKYKMADLINIIKSITGKEIKITFDNVEKYQYATTPHSYSMEESLKIIANPYIDIGQGITKLLEYLKYGK
jgi:UDP-glucose 4-epimerase